jgi:hypothetical protein
VPKKSKKSPRRTRKSRALSPSPPPRPQVLVGPGEMPEGAELSDEDVTALKSKKNKLKTSRTRHLLGDVEDASNLESVNITIGTGTSEQRASTTKVYQPYDLYIDKILT